MTSKTITNSSNFVEVQKTIDQCKWTNFRPDVSKRLAARIAPKKLELMVDGTGCDGSLRNALLPGELDAQLWLVHPYKQLR
ncbi:hypothetical protein BDW66DRAFT_133334 [Aspergillus desertorum]